MAIMVAGLFIDSEAAGKAVSELKEKGYTDKISIVAKDEEGEVSSEQVKNDVSGGAVAGAGLGALFGMVTGLVVASLPPTLVVAGPLVAGWGLTGTALGALSGGIVGALVDAGFDENRAEEFEHRLLEGDVMVAATGDVDRVAEMRAIMEHHGAIELVEAAG